MLMLNDKNIMNYIPSTFAMSKIGQKYEFLNHTAF